MPPMIFPPSLGLAAEAADRKPTPVLSLPPDAFFVAEVLDASAHLGTVKVMSAVSGPIEATVLGYSSGVYGPRKIGAAFPPHTQVVVFNPPGTPNAYVLGAVPTRICDKTFNLSPDWIVPGSLSGIGSDRVHWQMPLNRPNGVTGDINYGSGRPCDELPGDYGYINEMGCSLGIGRLMSWLRASHFCGVEAHWLDDLLRLTGRNYEVMLSSCELRILDDEGEHSHVGRWGPYPWETLGVYLHTTDFSKRDSGRWGSGRAGREPVEDDQMGIWRVHDLRGYLGDLRRTIVGVPKDSNYAEGPETMSRDTIMPGVMEVGFNMDGAYFIRSAKGVLVEKTVDIPKPKEKIDPDDPTGDTAENYKSSGAWGDGTDHNKPLVEIPDDKPGMRALMAFERHALLRNFFGNLPIFRHAKDWFLPEETASRAELGLPHGLYQAEKNAAVTDIAMWMPLPAHSDVKLDHRGEARYYSGRARWQIEDDGSVLFEDAYGSQIHMTGGNIVISARNDVILQPGRNMTVMSPHDTIIKAGNAVDISASLSDVRVKAQGNLMMTAVDKGVLIESQSENGAPDWNKMGEDIDSRGVLIRASKSSLVAMSHDVYIRSGVPQSFNNDGTSADELSQRSGALHIDAGGGLGDLYLHGGNIVQRAGTKSEMIVGSTGFNEETASFDLRPNELTISGRSLNTVNVGAARVFIGHEDFESQVDVLGNLLVQQNMLCAGGAVIDSNAMVGGSLVVQRNYEMGENMIVKGDIVCHAIAADKGGGMLPSTGDEFNASEVELAEHPTTAKDNTTTDQDSLRSALQLARQEDNETVNQLLETLYGDNSEFASAALVTNATFTFRLPEEYGTDGDEFYLPETRWQQYNRLLFGVRSLWDERSLRSPYAGKDTMPYPGYEIWEQRKALITLDHGMFDFSTGSSVARSELEDKELPTPKAKTFKTGYIVTLQSRSQT